MTSSPQTLQASTSIFGILSVGSVISISRSEVASSQHLTITAINSALNITVSGTILYASGTTFLHVFLVESDSVQVARRGTGNSTSHQILVTATADNFIPQSSGGYFRIKMSFNGRESITSKCVPFSATAAVFQSSINTLGFDFNGDGAVTPADNDHVTVTRAGDGSVTSGYGYAYTLLFSGPVSTYASSNVLGNSAPVVEVMDEGHYGGCSDVNSTVVDSPVNINYGSSVGRTTWYTSLSTLSLIQPGDRVRMSVSATPYQLYRVVSSTAHSITVDAPLTAFSSFADPAMNMSVSVVRGSMPDYNVRTLVVGEDSYAYDVYFTGPHMTNVMQLVRSVCASSGYSQHGGMLHSVAVSTVQQGGSQEVQSLTFTSSSAIYNTPFGGYWKIVLKGVNILGMNNGHEGYVWGVSPAVLQSDIAEIIGESSVSVTVEGYGSTQESPQYVYSVLFNDQILLPSYNNLGYGAYPVFDILIDQQISSPYYTSYNTSFLQPQYTLDDLSVYGKFNGSIDSTYTVVISAAVNTRISCYNQFKWCESIGGSTCTLFGANQNITAGQNYSLSNGVSISFLHGCGHYLSDSWVFSGVRCTNVLPKGSGIKGSIVRAGDSGGQIVVNPGYSGTDTGINLVYKKSPVFSVQNQNVQTYSIVSKYPGTTGNNFSLALNLRYENASAVGGTTSCLSWNSEEAAIESALSASSFGLCVSTYASCVSVTRYSDDVSNPNGFNFNIYIESSIDDNYLSPSLLQLSEGTCSGYIPSLLSISKVDPGSMHTAFSRDIIPLASPSIPYGKGIDTPMAYYKGVSATRLPLYKVDGNYWSVKFNSNLGNLNPLIAAPTKYGIASLSVRDDVVQGVNPNSEVLTGLLTGVQYSVLMQSYTRGPSKGYSAYSTSTSTSTSVPSGLPPAVRNFQATDTLRVMEVQEVAVYGTRLPEIQSITTSAEPYAGVQSFVLTADPQLSIAGNFTLRFPEVQSIVMTARYARDVVGSFQIVYSYYDFSVQLGVLTESTDCLDVTSSADDVSSALSNLPHIGLVEVVRSGYGGYSDSFGYTWTVTFSGNQVAGNVQKLSVLYGSEGSGSCANSAPVNLKYMVSTVTQNQAVGLDSEVQVLTVSATNYIAEGSYILTYPSVLSGNETTACIQWDASAEEVQSAILNGIESIDDVLVERTGDASLASNYGYTYNIFYTGNAMHARTGYGQALPLLFSSPGGCIPFSHLVEGQLMNMSSVQRSVSVVRARAQGFHLSASGTTSDALQSAFSLMPSYVTIDSVQRSLSSDNDGYQYTVNFALSMGRAAVMVCGMDPTLSAVPAMCAHYTVVEGNALGGYFAIGSSALLPYDVSAADMVQELELLSGVGSLAVTRSESDTVGGYTWTITYLTAVGNQSTFLLTNLLTGSGAAVGSTTVQDGNYLGGSYILKFKEKMTSPISFNASASVLQAALSNIANAVVVKKSVVSTEGGAIYSVIFNDQPGDLPLLVAYYKGSLTGVGAVVNVRKAVKGAIASGASLKLSYSTPLYCSQSQVLTGVCGIPVDSYAVQVYSARGVVVQSLVIYSVYDVQIVRVSADALYRSPNFTGEDSTGSFRLSYNHSTTGNINSHASALDVRTALEALPSVRTVAVARTYSTEQMSSTVDVLTGSYSLECSAPPCDFANLPPGELIMVSGVFYKVGASFGNSAAFLPLASPDDSSIPSYYTGPTVMGAQLFRWARGYEWTVTFLSVEGGEGSSVLPLSSPQHALNPVSSTVGIRPSDCDGCAYVTELTAGNQYIVQITPVGGNGKGSSSSVTATPMEIPGPPTSVIAVSLSGTQVEVFFSPPTGTIVGISSYTISWDTTSSFTNAISLSASCVSIGYGDCDIFGAAVSGLPPYPYVINGLSSGSTYYIRVAARNSLSVLTADPTGTIPDVTRWSSTISITPTNQLPGMPQSVVPSVSGLTYVQVLITPPTSTGGYSIDEYLIEWDADLAFTDVSTYGSIVRTVYQLSPALTGIYTGVYIYEISGLLTGQAYWVRVSAHNALGFGTALVSSFTVVPSGKADSPGSVSVALPSSLSPITTAAVTWTAPTQSNGGSPVTGYLVEWYEPYVSIPDVQLVQFVATNFPSVANGKFSLSFGPTPGISETTSILSYLTSASNVRSELMGLGYSDITTQNYSSATPSVMGNLQVARSLISGAGYQWKVTFLGLQNQGDQVLLTGTVAASTGEDVLISKLVHGQRAGGQAETQIITILASDESGSNSSEIIESLGGYFRLSFKSNTVSTAWLSVSSSAPTVARALTQLNSMRAVSVSLIPVNSSANGVTSAGFQWTVTFSGAKGNQPALTIDSTYVTTTKYSIIATIADGDNSLGISGSRVSLALIGEYPALYRSVVLGADARTYVLSDLTPGSTYRVEVSTINANGVGVSVVSGTDFTPLKITPQPPLGVAITVHPGSASSLDISYQPPLSDGGSPILAYRVELDTTKQFTNPIHAVFACPTDNTHSIYSVTTAGSAADPLIGGSFLLTLSRNGTTFNLPPIPYDAPAMSSQESGAQDPLIGVVATLTSGSNIFTTDADVSTRLFPGDRVQFITDLYPSESFTVDTVNSGGAVKTVALNGTVYLPEGTNSETAKIYRMLGGAGTSSTSRVACTADSTLCPPVRTVIAGSMQSILQDIPEALLLGVDVSRSGPDSTNGYTWRVTFVDQAQPDIYNFILAPVAGGNNVKSLSGNTANLTVTRLADGFINPTCSGVQQVPTDKALTIGQHYYARVFSINEVGYSLPMTSALPQKPMVVPGRPTAVTLIVFSATELRVIFNPPSSDGGDAVTSYKVEYSTRSDFLGASAVYSTFLSAGAPFSKTISGLTNGVFYYVRVSAANSQGYGSPTGSSPRSMNPHQQSDGPTDVILRVTSGTMITVSFGLPLNNGGDVISGYRVEWDISVTFSSDLTSSPNKGFVDLTAASSSSYTISKLSQGPQMYYVRVYATNSGGRGSPTLAAPASVSTALQVPGRPHTIYAATGSLKGQILVSWQRPRVPWHSIPCSGLVSTPGDCPVPIGGSLPQSDGGALITSYVIAFNELEDFSGYDSGELSTVNTATSFTVTNLTPGRVYFIRVLARNAQGSGEFCSFSEANCLLASTRVSAIAKS